MCPLKYYCLVMEHTRMPVELEYKQKLRCRILPQTMSLKKGWLPLLTGATTLPNSRVHPPCHMMPLHPAMLPTEPAILDLPQRTKRWLQMSETKFQNAIWWS